MKTLPLRPRHSPPTCASLIAFLKGALDHALNDIANLGPVHTCRLHRLEVQLLTRNLQYADLVRERV